MRMLQHFLAEQTFFNILISSTIRGKPQAPYSSFLAFLIASRSSYIIIQFSCISFSPKIFRLTDLDISFTLKYNITVI